MYRRRLSTPNGDLWPIGYSSSSSMTTRGTTANGEDTLKAGRIDESGACSREHIHDYRQFEVLWNRDPDNIWIATLWRAGAFSAGACEGYSEGREVDSEGMWARRGKMDTRMESPQDKCVNKGGIRGGHESRRVLLRRFPHISMAQRRRAGDPQRTCGSSLAVDQAMSLYSLLNSQEWILVHGFSFFKEIPASCQLSRTVQPRRHDLRGIGRTLAYTH
ncbi:hypothetical protein PC9H_008271 [Pleurotus ostreatus]|uniref:Uncharacterized protein n=1 Tax=Pleurotus ostreatus TaxID=5322 RepID=A0A8H7DV19_PLEOS|nr:uncharacterized protein PC9H_008271 [Pleurotus ostreatus]KAF7429033.1 hypothetical protein PC9H_008271 [Pleurotus ostreatus]